MGPSPDASSTVAIRCHHGRVLGACLADDCPDRRNWLRRTWRRATARGFSKTAATLTAAGKPNILDYAYGHPDPAFLHANGIAGVSRYLSTSTGGKVIQKPEYDGYLRAGVAVVLNWENTSSDYLGGRAQGMRFGQLARQMARALGHPDERPITASIDTGVSPAQLPTAIDYIAGFNDAQADTGYFRQGCYATRFVLDALYDRGLIRVGWQPLPPYGWYGNGTRCPRAQMYQLGSQSYPQFTFAYDENELRAGVTDYGQYPRPNEPPPPVFGTSVPSIASTFGAHL